MDYVNKTGLRTRVVSRLLAALIITISIFGVTPVCVRAAGLASDTPSGAVAQNTVIRLTASGTGEDIYYTDDGSSPLSSPTKRLYSTDDGLIITQDTVIKAVSCTGDGISSQIYTFDYTCQSLIKNSNFDSTMTGWTAGAWTKDTGDAHTGTASARCESGDGDRYMYTEPIPINAAYRYSLSAWVKTEGITTADGFSINVIQGAGGSTVGWYGLKIKSLYVTGLTQGWTRYSAVLDGFSSADVDSIRVYARLDGGCSGTAWVDDFCLTALQSEHYPVEQIETNTASVQGNIYARALERDISYTLRLRNNTHSAKTVAVRCELFNSDTNESLSAVTRNIALLPEEARSISPDVSAAKDYGVYRLDVTLTDTADFYSYKKSYYMSRIYATKTTAMTEEQRIASGYGSTVHMEQWDCNYKKIIDQAVLAGSSWIRDGIRWYSIEKNEKGVYDFPEYWDNYLTYAKQKGIKVCLALAGGNSAFYGSETNNHVPVGSSQIEGFAAFAAAVASRYSDRIYALEIFNEWNGSFNPGGATAADYAALLKKVYPAIKEAAPDMKVVCGATSGCDIAWLKKVFQNGGYSYCDIVSVHPYILMYEPERNLDSFALLKDSMKSFGEEKPVWLTEFGYSSYRDAAADFVPGYSAEKTPLSQGYAGCSDAEAAAYASRVYTLLQTGVVDKVFWYCLVNKSPGKAATDNNTAYNKEMNFGLSRSFYDSQSPLSAKSAMVAVNAAHTLLFDTDYTGRADYTDSLRVYSFRRRSDSVGISAVSLAEKTPAGYEKRARIVPDSDGVCVYDIYGNKTADGVTEAFETAITAYPIFISGGFSLEVYGNLISNSGFEGRTWRLGAGTAIWERVCEPENVHGGIYSMGVTPSTSGIGQKWIYVPVKSGRRYLYSAWIKCEEATGVSVKFREAVSDSEIGTWFGKTPEQGMIADAANDVIRASGTTGWKRYTCVIDGLKDTSRYLKIYCSADKGSGRAWFDDISLTDITNLAGDVNGDGERNILDLLRIKKLIAGCDVQCYVSDLNDSGDCDSQDIAFLVRLLIGTSPEAE